MAPRVKSSRPFAGRAGIVKECQCFLVRIPRIYDTSSSVTDEASSNVASYFLLLHLATDSGIEGVGEMSDLPVTMKDRVREASYQTGLSPEAISCNSPLGNVDLTLLCNEIESAVRDVDPFDIRYVLQEFRQAHAKELTMGNVYYSKAISAINMALCDLIGKSLNTPFYNLVGGAIRDRLQVSWVAYIRSVSDLRKEISDKLSEGFRSFKLMMGTDTALDNERVRVVREMAGPDASIRIDAVGNWTVEQAIQRIDELECFNLQGVETPVSCTDVEKSASVRAAVNVPLIEHTYNTDYAMALWAEDAADIINVVPMMTSGMDQAKNLLNIAEMMGKQAIIGSAVELGPGTAAALHLGVSSPAVTLPCDLIGPGMCVDDVITEPFRYENGCLIIRDKPGLGVTLDPRQLSAWEYSFEAFSEDLMTGFG